MKNIKFLMAIQWVLISFILAIIICLFSHLNYLQLLLKISQSEFEANDGHVIYSIQHEDNPLNKNLEFFEKLYGLLIRSSTYQYFELYNQYLEMPNQAGAFYEEGTGELLNQCEGIKCIQVNDELINNCGISVSDGQMFKSEDFVYKKGETIPVLMGKSYSELYNIGDIFEAEYLFDEYQFEIIGFLNETSNISVASYNMDLDKYIVMPSFSIDSNIPVTDGLKIHYANKTSGFVRMNKIDSEEFNETIEPILKNAQVGNYSWTITPSEMQYKEIFHISINQTRIIIIIFCIIVLIFGEICLIYHCSKYGLENKYNCIKLYIFHALFTIIIYIVINYLIGLTLGIKLIKNHDYIYLLLLCLGVVFLNNKFHNKYSV